MDQKAKIRAAGEEWIKATLYELECKETAAHAALGLRQAHQMVLNAEDKKRSLLEEIMHDQVHSWTPKMI